MQRVDSSGHLVNLYSVVGIQSKYWYLKTTMCLEIVLERSVKEFYMCWTRHILNYSGLHPIQILVLKAQLCMGSWGRSTKEF